MCSTSFERGDVLFVFGIAVRQDFLWGGSTNIFNKYSLQIEQRTDTTEVQVGEPMSSIGITYRNVGKRILTRADDSKIIVSSKPTLIW